MDFLASSAFHLGRMCANYAERRVGFIVVRAIHTLYQTRFREYGYRRRFWWERERKGGVRGNQGRVRAEITY